MPSPCPAAAPGQGLIFAEYLHQFPQDGEIADRLGEGRREAYSPRGNAQRQNRAPN